MSTVTRALFVNSGILGQRTFAEFVRRAFVAERDGVSVTQIVVSDDLTVPERLVRRLLCVRLSPTAGSALANVDFHRFRCEMHAGLLARRRIGLLGRLTRPFDVLHFHRQGTAYASLDLMRRVPAIVSCDSTQRCVVHNARSWWQARTFAPNVWRDGRVFDAARLIVATSEWAAGAIREEYPACRTEIAVMPSPTPLPPASDTWSDERFCRARAPGYRPRVFFMGGDFPRKGGYDLLRAWAAAGLAARASLDIVSDWPIDPAAVPVGVTIHRDISAYTPAWHARWRAADLFVLPTRDEAFGIVLQEAAAAGLPTVATRLNAVPEIVLDGVTGLLVPPRDEPALVAALEALIASPERRRDMGGRAQAHIAATADPDRYRQTLAAAIRRIAGH